jgi:hypothetical protein
MMSIFEIVDWALFSKSGCHYFEEDYKAENYADYLHPL